MLPILSVALLVVWTPYLFGEGNDSVKSRKTDESRFIFELTKNSPTIHTKQRLEGRHVTYYLGYRTLVKPDWTMGLGINYKSFTKNDRSELAFMTLQHEALYRIRIDTETIVSCGPRLLYMMPTRKSKFPLARDPEFQTELGAGISLMVETRIDKQKIFSLRIDRWRGTKTNRFHGFEVGVGLGWFI